jgi:clan AA aspartic protease
MIEGVVRADRQAVISLHIRANPESSIQVPMRIDTGFTGALSLPPEVIGDLGATRAGQWRSTLADGRDVDLPLYVVEVLWDGEWRNAFCQATPRCALIGMSMLYGYALRIDVLQGGRVTIRQPLE